ncbi:helix-turn-helix domain-containing protein [bacterium]|nr:helix-turn-helix domain-containing protein [bacterium]
MPTAPIVSIAKRSQRVSLGPAASLKLWHIKQCPLFSQLPPAELREVMDMANVVSCSPAELIPVDADSEGAVWIVKRGHVKMNYTDGAGRQAAVLLLGPGDMFGLVEPGKGGDFGEHCEALTACCLCRISRRRFEALLLRHRDLGLRVMKSSMERIAKLQVRLADLMMRPAEARLALILLELASVAGQPGDVAESVRLDLPISHSDLAQLIGTSREMVSYVMRRFRDRDLISSARKDVTLLDLEGLRRTRDEF